PKTDPLTVIENIHDQGGLAVLSHPFDTLRQFYDRNLSAIAAAVDGVEVENSRCVRESFNRQACAFAAHHDLPMTGGSDGHFPMEIGRASTEFTGTLEDAIENGTTRPRGHGRNASGQVATKIQQARRALGRLQ